MNIEPKPAYLKVRTPKQAMIAFHAAEVEALRENLSQQRFAVAGYERDMGIEIDAAWFEQYDREATDLTWDSGSVLAVWRDRLAFHEAALEYLTNG